MIGTRSANVSSIHVLVVLDHWHMCNHETHIAKYAQTAKIQFVLYSVSEFIVFALAAVGSHLFMSEHSEAF